jgi:hypothetical protein
MDNLGPHKNAGTIALLEAKGATVRFLPAYSPDGCRVPTTNMPESSCKQPLSFAVPREFKS